MNMQTTLDMQTVTTRPLTIRLDSAIRAPLDGVKCCPGLWPRIQAQLKIANPEYLTARKLGKKGWGIDPWLVCYEFNEDLVMPRGFMGPFRQLLAEHGCSAEYEKAWTQAPVKMPGFQMLLRGYQDTAVQSMHRSAQGLLVSPPGSGKTVMGMALITQLGQRALWICHTMDLADQARETAIKAGFTANQLGMVGGGKRDLGSHVTFALVQTLIRMDDLESLGQQFGTVILDECHHTPATSFNGVIHRLPALHRYGLTGSMERQDGLEVMTQLYFGDVLHEIPVSVMQDVGGTITPRLVPVKTSFSTPTWEKHLEEVEKFDAHKSQLEAQGKDTSRLNPPRINYTAMRKELLEHPGRNQMIANEIVQRYPGRPTLVITATIKHCNALAKLTEQIAPDCRTAVIHGGLGKEERGAILDAMRHGDLDVLFAVNLAKEGLDVPRLAQLLLVAGGRDKASIRQQVGRIQRTHPGKTDAVVVDFVDQEIAVMKVQYYARRRVYKELGMVL